MEFLPMNCKSIRGKLHVQIYQYSKICLLVALWAIVVIKGFISRSYMLCTLVYGPWVCTHVCSNGIVYKKHVVKCTLLIW